MIKIIGLDRKAYDEITDQIGPVLVLEFPASQDGILDLYDVVVKRGVRCTFTANNEEDGAIDFIFSGNKRYKLHRDRFFEIQIF